MRLPRGERGSGTVLALGLIAALLVVLALVYAVSRASAASTHTDRAADLAALAAADAARGLLAADPCTVATKVAARNDVHLASCDVSEEHPGEVQVGVRREVDLMLWRERLPLPHMTARSTARAGPPEALE